MENKKDRALPISSAETKKQNQDYRQLPSASEQSMPPDIEKKDVEKASELNKDGETDNTEKNRSED